IKDGEIENKGAFGVSAINTENGKTLWRYKSADKGLTNFVFADANTILLADKDDLVSIDARNGKRVGEFAHEIEKAQFLLINESGAAVVGGRDEIAAFGLQIPNSRLQIPNLSQKTKFHSQDEKPSGIWNSESGVKEFWRVKHKAPSRGVFRVVAGIALRATALYFRYGGLATSALNLAQSANVARSVLGLRWSGLQSRFGSFDLTTLASNSAKNYVGTRVSVFGAASRNANLLNRLRGLGQIEISNNANVRGTIIGGAVSRNAPTRTGAPENLLDRLDPARQADRLADYFLRRQRLADLRGNYMYFYTDLPKPFDRKGLIGVNVHTGQNARIIGISDPDPRFTIDETVNLLYSADGSKLQAFDILNR
ncbi:MAG: hypothetical protein M3T96_06665, partial [Acidobacteriota bacterium]|nr:hypothetical protein [Acidobacteriota bacterium]